MSTARIAFMPIARTTFDLELANQVTQSARAQLISAGLELCGPETLITDLEQARQAAGQLASQDIDLVLIFQASFADSTMSMAIADILSLPVLFWAVPEAHTGGRLRLNSFCGINLAAHAFKRAGRKYQHLYAAPNDPSVLNTILPLARAGHALNLLQQSRLGRVGENPAGFETCLLDAAEIERRFGLKIVQFDLETQIFPQARQVPEERLETIYAELDRKVTGLQTLEPAATKRTLGVYATLGDIAQQQQISGFAVRCWPEFFTELGCAACGAMSMLSDELTPCSCEADVNGTITQLMLQSLSGAPAFGTDMVSLDEGRDALVLWHCGLAPLSMADPAEPAGVTIHSNRKLPLLFEFTLKPGLVTIARLSEASGTYRLVIGQGEIIRAPKSFSGTSGLLTFDRPARQVLNRILDEGLEHHISLTYGNHLPALRALAELLNIPVLELT
ncbi:MAG: L-fucose/L-arabinose isomerase family protein [Anaerolineales bacterium]|nr:L-fucose/L-arabinose isomerase family protein [Anaerolineales bacterium]